MGCKFYNININSRGLHLLTDIKLILNYYRILKIIKPNFFISFTVKPNIYGSFVANFLNYKVI